MIQAVAVQVVGTISRKDLMGFSIEERLERLLINPPRKLSRSVVLALKKNYGHKKSRGGGGVESAKGGSGGGMESANGGEENKSGGPENNNLNGGNGGGS
jgi:hypothetical protein